MPDAMSEEYLREIVERANAAVAEVLARHSDWRGITSYPGYCASPDGVIWSCYWRYQGIEEKPMASHTTPEGYLRVRLTLPGQLRKNAAIHRLVCLAFHGSPKPSQTQVRHLNGIKTDNRPDNLAWATPGENGRDKVLLGETAIGSANGASVLHEYEVMVIKEMTLRGVAALCLSEAFDVTASTINRILSGAAWSHISAARTDVPDLIAEVRRMRQIVGEHESGVANLNRIIAAHRESAALKDQEITRLQTALRWYADLGNYTEGRHHGPDGSPGWPDIMVDRGQMATAALKGEA